MTGWVWFAFVLGAGIGAPLRFVIDGAVDSAVAGDDSWSRGTLAVNAVGSLVFGVASLACLLMALRPTSSDSVRTQPVPL